MKDLTSSNIERQNILNNRFAVEEIQKAIGIEGFLFENEYKYTIAQVANLFEVDEKTIRRYLDEFKDEIQNNGYDVLKGNRLKDFKLILQESSGTDIDVLTKTPIHKNLIF